MVSRLAVVVISLTTLASSVPAGAQASMPVTFMVRELQTPAAEGTAEPNLTRGRDGLVYLSWIQKNPDTSHTLFFSRFDSAGWAPARPIGAGRDWFVNWADFPALAVGDGGSMLASWLKKSGEDTYAYDVMLSRSLDGGRTWETPFSPHDDKTETEHGFVSLYPLPAREFAAMWLDGREMVKPDGPMTLRYARIDSEGKLRDGSTIDPKVCDCCQTALARCSDGTMIALYRDRHDDEVRDITVLRHKDGNWNKPVPLHIDNWRIAGCPVNGPAVDSYEYTVVAGWFTMEAGDSARVYVAFSTNRGESFGDPLRVDLGAPLGRVDVCMLDGDRAAVVWLQPDKSDTKVLLRLLSKNGGMSQALPVAVRSGNRDSGFPRVAFDGRRIIVAWTDPAAGPRVRATQVAIE